MAIKVVLEFDYVQESVKRRSIQPLQVVASLSMSQTQKIASRFCQETIASLMADGYLL